MCASTCACTCIYMCVCEFVLFIISIYIYIYIYIYVYHTHLHIYIYVIPAACAYADMFCLPVDLFSRWRSNAIMYNIMVACRGTCVHISSRWATSLSGYLSFTQVLPCTLAYKRGMSGRAYPFDSRFYIHIYIHTLLHTYIHTQAYMKGIPGA